MARANVTAITAANELGKGDKYEKSNIKQHQKTDEV